MALERLNQMLWQLQLMLWRLKGMLRQLQRMLEQLGRISLKLSPWAVPSLLLLCLIRWQLQLHATWIDTDAYWIEAPSSLIFTETAQTASAPGGTEISSPGVEAGDLLLTVNRIPPKNEADANQRLQAAIASPTPTTIAVYRPSLQQQFSVPAKNVALAVKTIPPAVLALRTSGSNAQSGLQPGDLVTAINGKGLDQPDEAAGTSRLAAWLWGWKPDGAVLAAESILARIPPRGELQYQLLRRDKPIAVATVAKATVDNGTVVRYAILWVGFCFGLLLLSTPAAQGSSMPKRSLGAFVMLANLYCVWFALPAMAEPLSVNLRDVTLGAIVAMSVRLAVLGRGARFDFNPWLIVPALFFCLIPIETFSLSGFIHQRHTGTGLLILGAALLGLAWLREFRHGHLISLFFFIIAGTTATLAVMHLSEVLAAAAGENEGYFSIGHTEEMLFGRGLFPQVMVWTFFLGTIYLLAAFLIELCLRLPEQIEAELNRHRNKDADVYGLRQVSAELLTRAENGYVERLRPVSWSQTCLPQLGFIGTIVGLGQAMERIGDELLSGRAGIAVLKQGFGDIAFAFETTFLGLMGLFMLTAGEHGLRSFVARRLRSTQTKVDKIIRSLPTGSVVAHVMDVAVQASQVVEQVRRKRRFDSFLLKRVALVANHPVFTSIQAALLRPSVEFTRDDAFRNRLLTSLQERFSGAFEIAAISEATIYLGQRRTKHQTDATVVIVRAPQQYAVRFDRAGRKSKTAPETMIHGTSALRTLASADGRTVVIKNAHGDWLRIPSASRAPQTLDLAGLGKMQTIWVARSAHADWLFTAFSCGGSMHLRFSALHKNPGDARVLPLPADARWNRWCFNQQSGELLASGVSQEVGSRGTWFMRIAFHINENANPESSLTPQIETIPLDDEIDVARLWSLREKRLLIETEDQRLLLWETTHPEPRQLHHGEWQGCKIVASSGNWLAVVRRYDENRQELQMWSLRHDRLLRYESHKAATSTFGLGVKPSNWTVTADGRRLLAIVDGELLSWRFPRYRIDGDFIDER